ncbi:uncharacterized protein LOC135349120 isoform X3 [Halichondria panicea]|uniref:uncharacterized protein LOC135349120 isoform X3 n=1 Tax=Halichondria panicea TaxID=6063 RepID=UPI00312B768D
MATGLQNSLTVNIVSRVMCTHLAWYDCQLSTCIIYSFHLLSRQVILETFTGLSDDRDAANLVDHVEDECRDVTYFKAISDKKAMECTEDVLMVFFQTVKMCVSRIPKKRASINTVYDQFRDTLTSMTNSPA